jgi:hypothetical protein
MLCGNRIDQIKDNNAKGCRTQDVQRNEAQVMVTDVFHGGIKRENDRPLRLKYLPRVVRGFSVYKIQQRRGQGIVGPVHQQQHERREEKQHDEDCCGAGVRQCGGAPAVCGALLRIIHTFIAGGTLRAHRFVRDDTDANCATTRMILQNLRCMAMQHVR